MIEKQLLKVVGTIVSGIGQARLETKIGRGIVSLKRSQTALEFIKPFLAQRGIVQFTINQRGDSWATAPAMFLQQDPKFVLTYVFTQFPLSEIGYYGKDLTNEELVRDFKFLKKILKESR